MNAIHSISVWTNLVAFVTLVLICRTGSAQIFSELDDSVALNPSPTLRYAVNPRKPESLVLEIVRDSTNLPLDRLRFLSIDWVQEELGLGKLEMDSLIALIDTLDSFEKRDKWHYYAAVEEVATNARAKAKELQEQLKEFREEFPDFKWDRLDQIRFQFACLGLWPNRKVKSPIQVIKSKLNLSELQRKTFASIVKEELGNSLSYEACFSGIKDVLEPSQQRLFQDYMKPFRGSSVHPAIALAHCRDMLKYDSPEEQLDPAISDPIVLTMHGRMAVATQYLVVGSLVYTPRPWRRILDSIRITDVSWLELTKDQKRQLQSLRIIRQRDDGNSAVSYHGAHVFESLGPRPKQGSTALEYHEWDNECRRLTIKADSILGDAIKEILLPVQLDSLKTALAISKVHEFGPVHVLQQLHEIIEITDDQQKELLKYRRDRLKRLEGKFDAIDRRCREELSVDQLELLSRIVGPVVRQYPTIFLFLER